MRAYSNMPTYDFISRLRDAAINGKAAPLVIDQIDSLYELAGKDAELEAAGEETTKAEEARDIFESERDDLADALEDLLDALPDNAATLLEDEAVERIIVKAQSVLSSVRP